MPSVVLDFDVERLPRSVGVPPRYAHALILLRWHGRPVGRVWLPTASGIIPEMELREAVVAAAGDHVLSDLVERYIGVAQDDPPAPPATVAVCTRDRPDDLDRCLTALARLHQDGQEVLVVDSASRSDATERVCHTHGVRHVREERPGLDRARNRALREAAHPIVAFSDDDAAPDPAWLRALCRHFVDPRVMATTGLTMPLELETEAQEWFERTNPLGRGFECCRFEGTAHPSLLVGKIGAGANMALRRDLPQLVAPFDEALDAGTPTRSGGDFDMFARILAAGYTIVYEPAALSWHRHRRTWNQLRGTVFGYGVGVYAHLTAQALRRESAVTRIALGWARVQMKALLRSLLRRPRRVPLDLIAAELVGCAIGPFAYARSRLVNRR